MKMEMNVLHVQMVHIHLQMELVVLIVELGNIHHMKDHYIV